jgi:uncharacterized membrane protein YuzA (DUF378 family)
MERTIEMVRKVEPILLLALVIGGLNWGILGAFGTNVLEEIFTAGVVLDVIYVVVGIAALVLLAERVLGMLMHAGHGHEPRPHGT